MSPGKEFFKSTVRRLGCGSLLLATLLLAGNAPVISADTMRTETIDATAMSTSTELGKSVSVKVTILQFSTREDRQVLVDAFKKGQGQGLVDALSKMRSVGSIAITGTLGYKLSYIALIPSPTGRKIRFVTSGRIRLGEAYDKGSGNTYNYNLSGGEFDLNDSDKKKSAGVLYPAADVIINSEGQVQFELRKNAWKLLNIIDSNQAGSRE
jgi:hypothetical protein